MKTIFQNKPAQIALAALTSLTLAGQCFAGPNESVRYANRKPATRDVKTGRNANANINRNANINVNRDVNVNVDRDVDINVNRRPVHVDIDVDHHHGGFWAGVGTAIVVGAVVRSIPPTRTVVVVSGTSYYYVEGVYYVQTTSGYTVVGAPIGATVGAVPPGALTVIAGPTTYYFHNGTYYVQQGTAFIVISPPIGVNVTALPTGATQVVMGGVVYYAHGGIYYRPAFQNGVTIYTTVKL
jgi:hypothetical protein